MLRAFSFAVLALLFWGCKKEQGSRVAIYELKSFTRQMIPGSNPAAIMITHAELSDEPFVLDEDILFYTRATTTFTLARDINPVVRNFGGEKGFAVTVNGQAVYYGIFHAMILSSLTIGVATIDPIFSRTEVPIHFVHIDGNEQLRQADKRNDPSITGALQASGRLR